MADLTNDQITAGAAVLLPCPFCGVPFVNSGHPSHCYFEVRKNEDATLDEKSEAWNRRFPSPHIAEVAESDLLQEVLDAYIEVTDSAYCQVPMNEFLVEKVKLAIAASRRAPAPASAGQAAQQSYAIYQVRARQGVWTDVDREIYDQYTGASYERRIVHLAAQPAERAGQAGQVAKVKRLSESAVRQLALAHASAATGGEHYEFDQQGMDAFAIDIMDAMIERAAVPAELDLVACKHCGGGGFYVHKGDDVACRVCAGSGTQ